ncbi:ankyrin repeat-containing protein [Purpureocillium lilacinum]|uniref:Ankyrin repeat-containing protein n=1 Tax=Purpureocillium lilacinum TaxID=33203 RepID=A0A179F7D4_PURLI|nr:ankyrin repeat-containing protein [Purpureocillium lilacinum]OAQ61385.1 ankyrin repeat-containing protein [Purpureocillium lilacinum]
MASRDDYTVGWLCALPIEVAAAKATLDRVHDNLPLDRNSDDNNNYILGSLEGHNVVVAYPDSEAYGTTSVADVATQLHGSYTSVRFNLMVGIAGGVPDTKEDIRLGDVVVSKPTAGRPGVIQYDVNGERTEDQFVRSRVLNQPTPLLLTAMGKAETAAIFDESKMPRYISEIVQKDPVTFARPGPEQDVLFEPDYDHATIESEESGCSHCDPDRIRSRQPREVQDPIVHYGLIASSCHLTRHGATRDKFAHKHGMLCFETGAAGLRDAAQYLIIRGISDYADSHRSELWHAYAATAAAAYAKEVLSFIPTVSKTIPLATNSYAEAAPVLDALLLTRPEVDRKSLIALKGRRVDGTCEWLIQHPHYQKWLTDATQPLLWISGGPGKGKTMLAIYITEMLQPVGAAADNVLLYYFCSNRDKNRNTALTIMRGILHQWIDLHPHLAKDIKNSFEGTETTKYTISSFVSLWRAFLILIQQSRSSQVVCVLDGLDECEKESLSQLLDAVGNYLSKTGETARPRLKFIILSRPQPAVLESKLGQYQRIQLDTSDTEISHDVERYIFAKVAELASEQNLSAEMVAQVQQTLLAGADGTFLWVGFVANELQGRSWSKIDDILRHVPKGLGGIYQRLLQQISDKEALVPILQWVVLAARPLTLEELTVAAGIKKTETLPATQVTKNLLKFGGLLVKVEGDVVNLVHESAKEFFQSDQVKIKGINMFHMSQDTHRTLMQTCLAHVERGYGNPGRIHEMSGYDPFLSYASQYWPVHFHHAIHVIDTLSEFSRPFFRVDSPIRGEWWKVYWEQEKNGGSPPSFTLLHLAAYFGNVPWAKLLISKHARLISRKDNYGRTPLSWAVNQGHRDMVELLLDHAVTGQHRGVMSVLLENGARLEAKAEHGDTDTPLMRAILANSREMTQELLEHGARVDKLPALLGVSSLRGPADPMDERVKELLGLQEQVFLARFKRSSRFVDLVMKGLGLSLRFPLVLELMSLYLKFVALNRWDSLSVLQELVQENKTDELREWAKLYHVFFLGLVVARIPKRLKAMGDLSTQILQKVAPRDLQALLAITVFTGMDTKLTAVRHGWREGDAVTAAALSDWAAIACDRDALEFFHFGIREFLSDFDGCVRNGNREENVLRTTLLMTGHFAMIDKQEPGPIEYFSRVVAEFFEGYIGSSYEVALFSDANQACANELFVISESRDSAKLRLFLTSIFQFAQQAHEKGQDRFLNVPSAACLILCQEDATAHGWLIGEAIPEGIGALIAREPPGSLQKRACKTFVECLIIGKQYGLTLPKGALRRRVEQHLQSLPGVGHMMNRILGS